VLEKLKHPRISIRWKLIFLFLAVTLIPLGVATYLARDNAESALLTTGRTNQEARAQNTARVMDEYLNAHLSDASAAGALTDVRDYAAVPDNGRLRERTRAALTAIQKKDPNYESVALISPDGAVIASSVAAEEGTNLKFRPYFQTALLGKANISDASISERTGRPEISFAAPVRTDNGQVIGVVRAQANFGGILKRITDDAKIFGKGSSATLVDEYGLRLASGDASKNFTNSEGGQLFTAFGPVSSDVAKKLQEERRLSPVDSSGGFTVDPQPAIASAIENGKQGSAEIKGQGGKEDVLSFATLTSKPWHYVVTTPRTVFTSAADSTTTKLTWVGLITAGIAALVAFLFSMTMTRPIVKLAKVADAVSMGDNEAEVDVHSNDEIGDLASAFSRMVASVRFYMASFHEGDGETESTSTAA
jgi:methyl-accepting chemotaxis protein